MIFGQAIVAGALLVARFGFSGIPKDWRKNLLNDELLIEKMEQLIEAIHLPEIQYAESEFKREEGYWEKIKGLFSQETRL